MRGVGGAGEVEGGARRGHQSRDRRAETLPEADHSQPGLTSVTKYGLFAFLAY